MQSWISAGMLALGCLSAALPVCAKRQAPAPVEPVRLDGVEYTVPHQLLMGLVQATDIRHGTLLWRRQIYTVRYVPGRETDLQDVFITRIEAGRGCLRVTNERGDVYELRLDSLEVVPVRVR